MSGFISLMFLVNLASPGLIIVADLTVLLPIVPSGPLVCLVVFSRFCTD